MKEARLYIYNAGHGVCTLMTGKKDDDTPYCGVFDCGSKAFSPFCERAVIINDMKRRILLNAQGYPVQIDEVVISHQDKDHWSMLLDLFLSLNSDGYIVYNNTFFGGEILAWKLTSTGLYTVLNEEIGRKFIKRGYGSNSSYTAAVKYANGYMLSAEIFIYADLDDGGWCEIEANYNISKQMDIIVTYKSGEEDEDPEITPINFTTPTEYVSIDLLINNVILQFFPFDINIRGVLHSIGGSLSLDAVMTLERERDNGEEFITISVPIKRMVMGGGRIGEDYALLKDLFFYMSQVYGDSSKVDNPAFLWEDNGAFIIMDSDTINATERRFLDYDIDISTLKSSVIRNLTSVVVQFNIKEDDIILLPGDVTEHGFEEISELAAESIPDDSLKLMIAPHHGSDKTNIIYDDKGEPDEYQPLCELFEALLGEDGERNSGCNLVISGYNAQRLHPGFLFTKIAEEYFEFDKYDHPYACAYSKNDSDDKDLYEESLVLVDESTNAVFTTNVLPFCDELYCSFYLKYWDGNVIFDPWGTINVSNLKRRLPPDSVFID